MSWTNILKKFGFTWSIRHIFYQLDWRNPSKEDLKLFLRRNIIKTKTLMSNNEIPELFYKDKDTTMIKIFQWVVKNITYARDIDLFGTVEKWEDVDIIINNKKADCESMALLLYCVAVCHGVNPIQLRLVAGDVKYGEGKEGHSWIEYAPDSRYDYNNDVVKWIILDPAYDPKNNLSMKQRLTVEEDKRYLTRWFEVNHLYFK
jgi:hypothetical protein